MYVFLEKLYECNSDVDCLQTPFTSCAQYQSDRKLKCLCADRKLPLNGDCTLKPKGIKLLKINIICIYSYLDFYLIHFRNIFNEIKFLEVFLSIGVYVYICIL